MRNVTMIRTEPGLVSIPVEKAVYCENCENVSTSATSRCGICGSGALVELAVFLAGPPSGPGPGAAMALVA